eukprot:COSAG06_NODE_1475_length_9337_cov_6.585733_14_plen_106_part_00
MFPPPIPASQGALTPPMSPAAAASSRAVARAVARRQRAAMATCRLDRASRAAGLGLGLWRHLVSPSPRPAARGACRRRARVVTGHRARPDCRGRICIVVSESFTS